jgi:aspartate kinase
MEEETNAAISAELAKHEKAVIPGFYGTFAGTDEVKTFSRGGSDITGAIVARAIGADVYENWTDVSGILMADPRIVENPESIPRVTYAELRELSYLGAQVLHEDTIFPVAEKNIPLNIRNTNEPEHPGTIIMERFDETRDPGDERRFITGIAGKKDYAVVSISKRGLSSQVGAMRRVLEIFENHGLAVEYTPNGIDTFSMVVSGAKLEKSVHSIVAQLQEKLAPDDVRVMKDLAIVAAVGRRMAGRPGISGRIFSALGQAGVNIRLISQDPREFNVILGVDNADYPKAVQVLYNSFVK